MMKGKFERCTRFWTRVASVVELPQAMHTSITKQNHDVLINSSPCTLRKVYVGEGGLYGNGDANHIGTGQYSLLCIQPKVEKN